MILFYFVIGLIAGLIGVSMAKSRGHSAAVWFIICFLFPIALIGLLFVPKISEQNPSEAVAGGHAQIGAGNPARIAAAPQGSAAAPANPAFEAKWDALAKYDDDIASAVKRLESYGEPAIAKFKKIYGTIEDKSKIDRIVSDISEEFEKIAARLGPEIEKLKEQGYSAAAGPDGKIHVSYKNTTIIRNTDGSYSLQGRGFKSLGTACAYVDHYLT